MPRAPVPPRLEARTAAQAHAFNLRSRMPPGRLQRFALPGCSWFTLKMSEGPLRPASLPAMLPMLLRCRLPARPARPARPTIRASLLRRGCGRTAATPTTLAKSSSGEEDRGAREGKGPAAAGTGEREGEASACSKWVQQASKRTAAEKSRFSKPPKTPRACVGVEQPCGG